MQSGKLDKIVLCHFCQGRNTKKLGRDEAGVWWYECFDCGGVFFEEEVNATS